MASYSLAFQVGLGLGAVLWGTIIELAGYRIMYLSTLLTVVAILVLTIRYWPALHRKPGSTGGQAAMA
jgi:predicted MFS family arabinose efflux permease